MLDVFFVAGGFAAFFVAILYVFACDVCEAAPCCSITFSAVS